MKAIILAAGRGSRMGELTQDKPKCMAVLRGKPLLSWQIDALQSAGISDIAVVTGYRKEAIGHPSITQRFENTRWEKTNMVRSLMEAASWLRVEPCIVSYGDIFYDPKAVELLMQSHDNIALTYDVNFLALWQARNENPLDDLETFKVDASGALLAIGEKPQTLSEIEGQYMGLLRFTPEGWMKVESLLSGLADETIDKMDMTTLLRRLLQAGIAIRALPFGGRWGEVDNAADLKLYEEKIL